MNNNKQELLMTQETAEHYISLMLKKDILLTQDKWEEIHQIMEDGCREVLNELTHEIKTEMQTQSFDFSRN